MTGTHPSREATEGRLVMPLVGVVSAVGLEDGFSEVVVDLLVLAGTSTG